MKKLLIGVAGVVVVVAAIKLPPLIKVGRRIGLFTAPSKKAEGKEVDALAE